MKNIDTNFIFNLILIILVAFFMFCPIINLDSRLNVLETYHNINTCSECGQVLHN